MSGSRPVPPAALYLGVGVSNYDDPAYPALPRAVQDVTDIAGVLEGIGYETYLVADPDQSRSIHLGKLLTTDALPHGGPLIVVWSGHGEPASERRLVLVAQDTEPGAAPVVTADLLAGIATRTGASQILLVLDTCYSGSATVDSAAVADRVLQELPPAAERIWFGVLASTLDADLARDGLFGTRLLKLLREGPDDAELQRRWSAHNAGVRGDDLIDAVLKEWDSDLQQPKAVSTGNAWVMLPNPQHDPAAPAQVVEHLLLAARGIDPGEGGFYFTGRTAQLDRIVTWLGEGRPGVFVVTGPAGSGKSAIVGRVVSLSNLAERARLLEQGPLPDVDPGEGAIAAHVHARRLTADRLVETLDEQLVAGGVLPPHPAGRRNRGQLQGDLDQRGTCPAIAIDGLDEAGIEASRIAEDVVRLLAGTARILIGTRDVPSGTDGPSLVEMAIPSETIDLGAEALQPDTAGDVRAYVGKRLKGKGEPEMDAAKVADAVVRFAREQGEGLFLLARVITAQLRVEPIDTTVAGWEAQLAHSVEDAFARDLARIPPLRTHDQDVPQAARDLLAALAWGYGAGLPDDVWPIVASALSPTTTGTGYDRGDVFWVLGQAGRYIVEDGELGRAVYRLSHQRLTDYLRGGDVAPRLNASAAGGSSEERTSRVALALVDHYEELLATGLAPTEPGYLWLYTWRHCADGGLVGIDALRRLVSRDRPTFLPDLAMALDNLASRYSQVGRPQEAVAPAEEAVESYRELAGANPAFAPDLAAALTNLANRYSQVGRPQEAVAPTEEAVRLRREQAAANPAFAPDLARALTNLGIRYSEVGRPQEAVAPTEEAVESFRELAGANPAFAPDLAAALTNLGIRYSEVGRRQEAVAPTEEAVRLRREQAAANPAFASNLAMALNNLAVRYSEVGRPQEAVAPAEEVVGSFRELAAANPAFASNLAMALNNLAVRYREVGRRQEAVAPTEEAVESFRELAAANPAFAPDLAMALTNLANRYSQVGRRQEAVAPTEEAVRLRREQAAANPAFAPELARALTNLGGLYRQVGWRQEAVAPAEEAVRLRREQAAANPAFAPDLAGALINLGGLYSELGWRQEAVAPAEEAVESYRELAGANPALAPHLAAALTNLGSLYSEVGRPQEAVAPAEEAVRSFRELAAANPAFAPELAVALNNLAGLYSEVGRPQEAVAPAEEAVESFRELAAANPAFASNLAMALNNLGIRYSEVGRPQEAVAPTEEAVRLRREQAAANPAFAPDLAMALNNLAVRYSEVGRPQEAVAPAEEAVRLRREQAAANPAFAPELARALTNLANRYREVGRDAAIDNWWQETLNALADARSQAILLLRRAESRTATDSAAIADLLAAQALIADSAGDLIADLHAGLRARRGQDPQNFDTHWRRRVGVLPAWLLLSQEDIELVGRWLTTTPEASGRQFLVDHTDQLLADTSDVALDEIALLQADPSIVEPYRKLLHQARRLGIDEAYRPRLALELLETWLDADLDVQQSMLAEQATRTKLLDADVARAFDALRQDDPDDTSLIAYAELLDLARAGRDTTAFDALAEPERFPALLADLARSDPGPVLDAMATLATLVDISEAEQATGWFYKAVALAVADDPQAALDAARQARRLDGGQVTTWLSLLVELAPRHPNVVPLTQVLTESVEAGTD